MPTDISDDPSPPDLRGIFEQMTWRVHPESFALVGIHEAPCPSLLTSLRPPAQIVLEADETTVLLPSSDLSEWRRQHPRSRVESDLRWIQFDNPMAWDVVGFLARVTGALADAGIPVGAVCGYSRDHLFLAARHIPATRTVLATLCREASR